MRAEPEMSLIRPICSLYRGHFNDQVKLSVGRLCLDDLSNEMTFDVDGCLWRGGSS